MRRDTHRRAALAALTGALAILAADAARAETTEEEPIRAESALAESTPDEAYGEARTVRLDQGFVLDLPPGWVPERAQGYTDHATGRLQVRLVCRTPACRRTQETCTLTLRPDPVGGEGDDAARLDGLYASPMTRYIRIRDALTSTSKGATPLGPFAPVRFGARTWYAVETDAAPKFKSGLFAATVIGGRYLGAICKTCETGAVRHEGARALLASARRAEPSTRRVEPSP